MAYEDVQKRWLDALDNLERALDNPNRPQKSTEGLMKQWGSMMVETSQRSFVEQKLGEWEWPARYPGMTAPIINIAGTIQDFNQGRTTPKPNRFQDRPALVDHGMRGGIWGSISFQVTGPKEVAAGSNKPHAGIHMKGGESVVRVSEQGYQRGRDWLFTKQGDPKKGREGFVDKLWPALFQRTHRVAVAKRPFVGITPQLATDMIRATSEYFEREYGLGGGGRMVAVV
jgi:phage gpG-like protein